MSTLTAPTPLSVLPAPEAEAQPAPPEAPGPTALPTTQAEEPPLTGREVVEYLMMIVLGVLITAVTLWFYGLVQ